MFYPPDSRSLPIVMDIYLSKWSRNNKLGFGAPTAVKRQGNLRTGLGIPSLSEPVWL